MKWRETLLGWLRIPHEPVPPLGDRDITVFRAAPGFYKYQLVGWFFSNLFATIGLIVALGFSLTAEEWLARTVQERLPESLGRLAQGRIMAIFWLVEIGAIALFALQALGRLLLLKLNFEQRWYMVSDRSLRIREGLLKLQEKTMTFANVQQVSIRQGPIQRLFGIADLEVKTAGGGSHTEEMKAEDDAHTAFFRGIADAARVRDFIQQRVRQFRDAGLGDHDDVVALPASESALIDAARALAVEARLLRAEVIPIQGQ